MTNSQTLEKPETKTKLCLIAGNGELPEMLVKGAQKEGLEMTVFAVTKEAYSNLKNICPTYKFAVTEVFPILEKLKELDISDVTFIGKVPKLEFFKSIHKLEPRFMNIIKKFGDMKDDSLHAAISKLAEEEGLNIVNQTKYLKELFPDKQIFTNREPNAEEMEDIKAGFKLAKEIAAADVGQSIVIENLSPLAIEAIEGTNECIKRARKLSTKGNIVVCKVSKPDQDQRFDVPTLGLKTVKAAGKNSLIAFEANETFFVNQKEAIDFANKNNIAIISY